MNKKLHPNNELLKFYNPDTPVHPEKIRLLNF